MLSIQQIGEISFVIETKVESVFSWWYVKVSKEILFNVFRYV